MKTTRPRRLVIAALACTSTTPLFAQEAVVDDKAKAAALAKATLNPVAKP